MESFFQVRQARNHVTSLEDRTREIESQIENIRSKISEIRKNIQHREIQIEENESNLVQTGNERFIKIIEKENFLLDQARIKLLFCKNKCEKLFNILSNLAIACRFNRIRKMQNLKNLKSN